MFWLGMDFREFYSTVYKKKNIKVKARRRTANEHWGPRGWENVKREPCVAVPRTKMLLTTFHKDCNHFPHDTV